MPEKEKQKVVITLESDIDGFEGSINIDFNPGVSKRSMDYNSALSLTTKFMKSLGLEEWGKDGDN